MSWSVSAVGKAAAVAARVVADLDRIVCAEPEQSVKNGIKGVVVTALSAMPDDAVVKVEAMGSQYAPTGAPLGKVNNSVTLRIEPLYGFVE